MFVIQVTDQTGNTQEKLITGQQAVLGKARHCDLPLTGWFIGREHARVLRSNQGALVIEDLGQMGGTWINGSRIVRHGPLDASDEITIGSYKLKILEKNVERQRAAMEHQPFADPPRQSTSSLTPATGQASSKETTEPGVVAPEYRPALAETAQRAEYEQSVQSRNVWRVRVHEQLLETIDLRRRDLTRMTDEELRSETAKLIKEILRDLKTELPADVNREALTREVLNEAVGLGPLEELLADESVSEIMVNRHDEIFVERSGRLERYPLSFTGDRAVTGVIERIVAPLGRRIDESSPMVDARLKDGSRLNAIIPPLALEGPTLTIRKFAKKRLVVDDMLRFGSLSADMAEFLNMCVVQRKNLIVSGGTGSGKTTFLNLLSNFIPDGERIITIEDAAELKLHHSHLVSLESRPSNVEGRGQIAIRDLVKNALRMRPDRIVVGECRGGEALDMLQAMNTGHEGSMTTLHANAPRDALARLETLILMAGMDLPLGAIREQIASAVDVIVQQTRFSCGSRKVTSISEITGIEGGRIQLQELFKFDQRGYDPSSGRVAGHFTACDVVPSFYDELRGRGAEVNLDIFSRVAQ